MKVLLVTPWFPYPPQSGAPIRGWNFCRYLSQRHEIDLVSLCPPGGSPADDSLARMKELVKSVYTVEREGGRGTLARKAFGSVVKGRPFTLEKYASPGLERLLRERGAGGNYDLVHFHSYHTGQYWDLFPNTPKVLETHNVEAQLWARFAARQRPVPRLAAGIQARLIARAERSIYRGHDAIAACSDLERDTIARLAPDTPVFTVPNGVDTAYFQPEDGDSRERYSMVFCGSMDYAPNIQGAEYFVKDVFPAVQRKFPEATLYLVGKNPSARVRALAGERIVVTGTVDDVRPYLRRCQAVVVPLTMGAGTRLKILEAMAAGRAVVSTELGAEGIAYTGGDNILIADHSAEMAQAIGRVFEDEVLRTRLESAGRQLAVTAYDWGALAERFDEVYAAAVARHKKRRQG